MRQSNPGTHPSGTSEHFLAHAVVLALMVAGICLLFSTPSRAQISPGPLSKAHSSLTGTTHCNSCHVFGMSAPTFNCLDCHKEIAEALSNKHGYHFRIQMQNPSGKDCVRCHLEHNGESFKLVRWEPSEKQFDHHLTGYTLEGKHAAVACEKCHMSTHMIPARKALIQYEDPSRSFFAQATACMPCHTDPHRGQLGNECTRCHNVESWKAAKEFDHSKTRFPLTGLHVKVACEKCHEPDTAGGPARYKDMKYDTCTACHADPHRGEFKKKCESCHNTSSWKTMLPGFDFDHSKTKYPLLGKHAQVACSACHFKDDFKKEILFAVCKDCHTPDPHKGQFTARPKTGECVECHTVVGWKPSTFGVKEHDTSQYPLKGQHVRVDCAKCHIPAGKDTIYKAKFALCSDCHKDAHDNQFASTPFKNRCEECHTVRDWHRTTYTIAKHRSARFPLTGGHAAVSCDQCHKPGLAGRTDKILPFQFEDRTCTACHKGPHKGEFDKQMAGRRANGTVFGCEACHSVKSWADINGFDHSKTKYPLLGAHRTVACGECHEPTTNYESRFRGTPRQCEDCHKEAHGDQFLANDGQTHCAECHIATRWVPSAFNHEARTHLPLTGGHAHVPCGRCHTQTKSVGDKEIAIYKNTPNKCADCHGDKAKISEASHPPL